MTAGFDAHIDGDPASIEAAAEWFGALQGSLQEVERRTVAAHSLSTDIWDGRAADGYRNFASSLVSATREIEERAASAWDRFLSYKQQLEWAREDLAAIRRRAAAASLNVRGTFVEIPPTAIAPQLPANATPAQTAVHAHALEEYEALRLRQDAYVQLEVETTEIIISHNEWIREYLVPEEALALEPSLISELVGAENTFGLTIDLTSEGIENAERRVQARALQDHSDYAYQRAYERAAERSGNPGVRGGSIDPSDDAIERQQRRMDIPEPDTRGPILASRVLGGGGQVITGAPLIDELASGASPSTTLLEHGAGTAAGVATAAVLAGVASPVVVIIAPAAAGTIATYAASEVYQNAVPQHRREAIDRGITGG